IAARHRGRRGGHGAHGGEEPDRVRLPYPRGAGARGRRRARRRPAARGGGQELASRRPVVSRRAAVPERGGDRRSVAERLRGHAALARQAYVEAGVAERVRLIEGAALDVLPTLAPGFDAVFVDADKAPLAQYFEWSVRLLRPGGLLLCDNAFFHGAVVDPGDHSAEAEGVRAFNRLAASDPRVVAAVAPIRDGLVIGVKLLS